MKDTDTEDNSNWWALKAYGEELLRPRPPSGGGRGKRVIHPFQAWMAEIDEKCEIIMLQELFQVGVAYTLAEEPLPCMASLYGGGQLIRRPLDDAEKEQILASYAWELTAEGEKTVAAMLAARKL